MTIPVGYPKVPPVIEGEKERMTQFIEQELNIDDTPDFLTAQELLFEQRLDALGPDLVTLTQGKLSTSEIPFWSKFGHQYVAFW